MRANADLRFKMYYIGIDIGGTKCAVSLGESDGNDINIIAKSKFDTIPNAPYETLEKFTESVDRLTSEYKIKSIGISCGGPLNSKKGLIMSPPNLPGWDNIPVTDYFANHTNLPVYLQNDANACAVAEWKFGSGRGFDNMIFLTFGTGLGAGLILDGKLYSGPDDMAGEIGHVRLTPDGPVGYGKAGSAEGYCSGGGIRQVAQMMVKRELEAGRKPLLLEKAGTLDNINAKIVADLADSEHDTLCCEIYRISGEKLGTVLSMVIDLLNPEAVIAGSIFTRSANLLYEPAMEVIKRETLVPCKLLTAGLGENVGDYAALSVAVYGG